jgi:hypothetical protein
MSLLTRIYGGLTKDIIRGTSESTQHCSTKKVCEGSNYSDPMYDLVKDKLTSDNIYVSIGKAKNPPKDSSRLYKLISKDADSGNTIQVVMGPSIEVLMKYWDKYK